MSRNARIGGAAVIAVLLLALFYPTLRWLVGEWLGNDYYSHGPLVPMISGLVAWRLWRSWPPEQRRLEPANTGFVVAAGRRWSSICSRSASAPTFVGSLAMILTLAGLVWALFGTALLRRMAFPLLFLVFMVPLPFVEPLSVPLGPGHRRDLGRGSFGCSACPSK